MAGLRKPSTSHETLIPRPWTRSHRIHPEDLEAYLVAREAERPPAGEGWHTVRDLMRAANVSRAVVYRLIRRGSLPARTFGGLHYVRGEDFKAFLRSRGEVAATT